MRGGDMISIWWDVLIVHDSAARNRSSSSSSWLERDGDERERRDDDPVSGTSILLFSFSKGSLEGILEQRESSLESRWSERRMNDERLVVIVILIRKKIYLISTARVATSARSISVLQPESTTLDNIAAIRRLRLRQLKKKGEGGKNHIFCFRWKITSRRCEWKRYEYSDFVTSSTDP